MKKYDYKVIVLSTMLKTQKNAEKAIQDACDDMSKKGWELDSITSYDMGSKIILIFKVEL